jgi:uncharacterized protein
LTNQNPHHYNRPRFRKILIRAILLPILFYFLICIFLYSFQERFIFFPARLDKHYQFLFSQPFKEINIETSDGKLLNGLLFSSDSSRGLIFYLHGNAGALDSWGKLAERYTSLQYDVFMLDYRGYGKSEGSIRNERQFFEDVQLAYDEMKKSYEENKIVVLGYSIGTGAASWLASLNAPRLLLLQAPYYSLTDMMRKAYPIIPTFLLKYPFRTYRFIKNCKMPVIVFHGDRDNVIPYSSSLS